MLVQSQIKAPDKQFYQLVTLRNLNGMQIKLTDWGATLLSIKVPVNGQLRETLCSCPLEKLAENQAYLGATIGRFANRINRGKFRLNGKTQQLVRNQQNRHTLHGGNGFDQRRWQVSHVTENTVIFSLFSVDGDQGFAGNVSVQARYHLAEDNRLILDLTAVSDQDTALNLTNHAYFNLDGTNSDVRQHQLQLFADHYLPVDQEGIPNRPLTAVAQTGFDFRQTKTIAKDFLSDQDQQAVGGYDHAFLLQGALGELKTAAKLTSATGDLSLLLSTNQAAVQVYTGNFLAGNPSHFGTYQNYQAIALEPEALPDAPNHPEWYQYGGMQKANKPYHHQIVYQFVS
ncbi:galactose-1-epimerase [Gallibacterium melopsittaci]|uniref:Aldose 1-epimerase n=1 Tax=Gallibacterium melopsittaci TaxID=516063 RepID=A0ABV6HUF7_9PAST